VLYREFCADLEFTILRILKCLGRELFCLPLTNIFWRPQWLYFTFRPFAQTAVDFAGPLYTIQTRASKLDSRFSKALSIEVSSRDCQLTFDRYCRSPLPLTCSNILMGLVQLGMETLSVVNVSREGCPVIYSLTRPKG